ncbi:heat shock gene repressor HrcA [Beggiatoa alba B18LD]|uniref:Heat-inducible transcription repressor HrcA n=1 Tax=Beggiatoa alba B18LD TaxID=395493 RepID=I3CHF1_9GAMM|nr:heat-inducible transcriptional repressor HrcA [Beggiatoa alba]EIJ43044.1 heat shock gene repressor HrcA [Beggiatoa alba B18LD]
MLKATHEQINERAQRLLKILIDRYIRDGQPVGSRTLSKESDLDLSPATIRNVMADLEEMGLIFSPHTSAGRIPTVRGYRVFVDSLLQVKQLSNDEESLLRRMFRNDAISFDNQRLFEKASNLLSEVTHLTSVIMLPRRKTQALRHVEFLSLSKQRVLAILVINEHEVQNRIIHTSRAYSSTELEHAANYLNAAFAGKDIHRVRQDLVGEMRKARQDLDNLMETALEMADKTFTNQEEDKPDFVVAGQTHLMDIAELSTNIDKLRHLFSAFNQKCDILHLLDQAINAQGIQIFIGEESGYEVFDDCSVITSPYKVDGSVIGVLGVIGPTRMAYERVIPIVDLTAKLLSSALK